MVYDEYKAKILKIAAALNKILKHTVLLVCAAVLLAGLIISFFTLKGRIISENAPEPYIEYGQDMKFKVNAILSGITYEYSDDAGEEWSEQAPLYPGAYRVRAFARTAFGKRIYSDSYTYEIQKKPINLSIAEDSIVYGDDPTVIAALAYEDTLECRDFIFGEIIQSKAHVTVDVDRVRVTDALGNDVTYCYDIQNAMIKKIEINKRPLHITVSSKEMEYDGTPIAFDGYEISDGSLAYDDTLGADLGASSITNVGTLVSSAQFKVLSHDGVDVSEYYSISVDSGTLKVNKRPIVIKTYSASKVYDGEYLEETSFDIFYGYRTEAITDGSFFDEERETASTDDILEMPTEPVMDDDIEISEPWMGTVEQGYVIDKSKLGIIQGQSVEVVSSTRIKNAEWAYNSITIAIRDEDGKDQTSNYSMFYMWGELNISKRPLYVKTPTEEFVYDGKVKSSDPSSIEYSGLCPTDTLNVTGTVSLRYPGSVSNQFGLDIVNADGENVADNYRFNMDMGTLTVQPRKLTLKIPDVSVVYDGMPHISDIYDIEFLEGELPDDHSIHLDLHLIDGTAPLSDGQLLDYTSVTDKIDLNYKYNDEILIFDALEDVSNCFDVEIIPGSFEILPRNIDIITSDAEFVYDGKEHYNIEFEVGGLGLALTDQIAVDSYTVCREYVSGGKENILRVSISNMFDKDTSDNYKINYIYGTINIKKLEIAYRSSSFALVYNGHDRSYPYLEFFTGNGKISSLAEGDRYVVTNSVSVTDVSEGIVENRLEFRVEDAMGNNMSHCYDMRFDGWGDIYIKPREVYIDSLSSTWIYDGKSHSDIGWIYTSFPYASPNTFIEGDRLNIGNSTDAKNIGNTFNALYDFSVYSTVRKMDVTENYSVRQINKGIMSVKPREISVRPKYTRTVYSGSDAVVSDWEYYSSRYTLADGHYASVKYANFPNTQVGKYLTAIDRFIIFDSNGNDVTHCYDIKILDGIIDIDKLSVEVTSGDKAWSFDGHTHTNNNYSLRYVNGSEIAGHSIAVSFTGEICNVGSCDNTFSITIYDQSGNDVTDNYDIRAIYGKLTVEAAKLGWLSSSSDGLYYIKTRSYLNYNGHISDPDKEFIYSGLVGLESPDMLAGIALSKLGHSADIHATFDGIDGSMYYRENKDGNSYFRLPKVEDIRELSCDLAEYADYEAQYRRWVYENYLYVDTESKYWLDTLIRTYSIDVNDKNVFDEVAYIISEIAVYGYTNSDKLDASDSMVADLISHKYGHECLARHYAAAAVMMFRNLGIPARYVEGHIVNVNGGNGNAIIPQHSWAEVYIDGFGWVKVEIAAMSGTFTCDGAYIMGGGVSDPTVSNASMTITVSPESFSTVYSGESFVHNGDIYMSRADRTTMEIYENLGFDFRFTVKSGNAVDVGVYDSYVTARVFYGGVDVTDRFNIICLKGKIEIKPFELTLTPEKESKTFDGKPFEHSGALKEAETLMQLSRKYGFVFDYRVAVSNGDDINAGSLGSVKVRELRIYNDRGEDITDNFDVTYASSNFYIQKFTVEVYLLRNQKTYDGHALDYSSFSGRHYRVLNTLPAGYFFDDLQININMVHVGRITNTDLNMRASDPSDNSFSYLVTDMHGNDCTDNFDIVFEYMRDSEGNTIVHVPMEITPRSINIDIDDLYGPSDDDDWMSKVTYKITGEGLADGDSVDIQFCLSYNASLYSEIRVNSLAFISGGEKSESVYLGYMANGYVTIVSDYSVTIYTGNYRTNHRAV